jgi:2-methylcitrate dehydratase PrpD
LQTRYAISYSAQQVSGLWSWAKDKDHVEKAFDFAGMGARNGVTAVDMAHAGFTGVYDVLDGTHNLFIALLTTYPKRLSKPIRSAIGSSRRLMRYSPCANSTTSRQTTYTASS